MLFVSRRTAALNLTKNLLEKDFQNEIFFDSHNHNAGLRERPTSTVNKLLFDAGISVSPFSVYCLSIIIGVLFALSLNQLLSIYAMPIFFLLGASIPFTWLIKRAENRAASFSEDYPTVLLAMASSLKVGHTPIESLRRATQLLPKSSCVREEISHLQDLLHRGVSKELAINNFGLGYRVPDLELFRSAFLIVLEHGGQFAPSLHRLACLSRDRSTLIASARVTTATMRMTSNFLLAVAPLLLAIVSLRSKDYWQILVEHPTANSIATVGIVLITASYIFLRHMSNFKP